MMATVVVVIIVTTTVKATMETALNHHENDL
jgi:hypothetical protein